MLLAFNISLTSTPTYLRPISSLRENPDCEIPRLVELPVEPAPFQTSRGLGRWPGWLARCPSTTLPLLHPILEESRPLGSRLQEAHFNVGISFNSVSIDRKPYFTCPLLFLSSGEIGSKGGEWCWFWSQLGGIGGVGYFVSSS